MPWEALTSLAIAMARVLYLFAPLLVSAALSGVALRFQLLQCLARPIDGGATLWGKRLFGDGKTWRGAFVAIVGSIATVAVQQRLRNFVPPSIQIIAYGNIDPVLLGGAIGGGAIVGELPNSFVKRRLGIPRGGTATGWRAVVFWTWDQLDLLVGAWPPIACFATPTVLLVAVSVGATLALHPLVALVGYLVGARKSAR